VSSDPKDLLHVDRIRRWLRVIQPVTCRLLGAQALEVAMAGRPGKHIQKFEVARRPAQSIQLTMK
jgi:hypothetical protein